MLQSTPNSNSKAAFTGSDEEEIRIVAQNALQKPTKRIE